MLIAGHGFFSSAARKELRDATEAWAPQMRAALDPAAVSAEYRAKLAPFLAVFDRTHELVRVLALLLEGWGLARGNEVTVEAATGPLVVGAGEEEDAEKLRSWHGVFVKIFGASGLPSELSAEAVKKQLAAHEKAREELPGTGVGQVFRGARATLVALRKQGKDHWTQMHDLLDGEFGRGAESFAKKAAFGYDRRLTGAGASRKKRAGENPAPPAPAK